VINTLWDWENMEETAGTAEKKDVKFRVRDLGSKGR
jgi:hypothetical protein